MQFSFGSAGHQIALDFTNMEQTLDFMFIDCNDAEYKRLDQIRAARRQTALDLNAKCKDDGKNLTAYVEAGNAEARALKMPCDEFARKIRDNRSQIDSLKSMGDLEIIKIKTLRNQLEQHKHSHNLLNKEYQDSHTEYMNIVSKQHAAEALLKEKTEELRESKRVLDSQSETMAGLDLSIGELEDKMATLLKEHERKMAESKLAEQVRQNKRKLEQKRLIKLFDQSQQTVANLKKSLEENS